MLVPAIALCFASPASAMKGHALLSLAALSAAILFYWARATGEEQPLSDVQVSSARGNDGRVWLPWWLPAGGQAPRSREFTLRGRLWQGPLSGSTLRLFPDDCLTRVRVNGQELSLQGLSPEDLCDRRGGVSFSMGPWLRSGWNKVELTLENRSGPVALRVERHRGAFELSAYAMGALVLLTCALCWPPGARPEDGAPEPTPAAPPPRPV